MLRLAASGELLKDNLQNHEPLSGLKSREPNLASPASESSFRIPSLEIQKLIHALAFKKYFTLHHKHHFLYLSW